MSARKRRTRRLRRKANAITKHGPTAGPRHTLKSGRTGKIRATKIKGSRGRERVSATAPVPLSTSSPPTTGIKGGTFQGGAG